MPNVRCPFKKKLPKDNFYFASKKSTYCIIKHGKLWRKIFHERFKQFKKKLNYIWYFGRNINNLLLIPGLGCAAEGNRSTEPDEPGVGGKAPVILPGIPLPPLPSLRTEDGAAGIIGLWVWSGWDANDCCCIFNDEGCCKGETTVGITVCCGCCEALKIN